MVAQYTVRKETAREYPVVAPAGGRGRVPAWASVGVVSDSRV